jgi:predicted Zn-dependent protease
MKLKLPKSRNKKRLEKKKTENSGEELIEEIANKEELTPEGEKQIQQLQIIEQFIKTQPSLTQTKEKPFTPPSGDLSTIKTGEFGDNIVSETLVEILVKQGKKDKAIEVLKKLIWKFPQKKAYFAAQIEDLRK